MWAQKPHSFRRTHRYHWITRVINAFGPSSINPNEYRKVSQPLSRSSLRHVCIFSVPGWLGVGEATNKLCEFNRLNALHKPSCDRFGPELPSGISKMPQFFGGIFIRPLYKTLAPQRTGGCRAYPEIDHLGRHRSRTLPTRTTRRFNGGGCGDDIEEEQ